MQRENLINEVRVNFFCQFCVIMDVKCSFSSLVGGSCSYEPRDKSRSTEVIQFLNCKRDIAGHKSSLSITDVETEIEARRTSQKKRKGRKRTWQKCLLFDMEETGNFYSSWFRYVYIIFHLFQPNRSALKWRSNVTLQLKHFVSTFLFFILTFSIIK